MPNFAYLQIIMTHNILYFSINIWIGILRDFMGHFWVIMPQKSQFIAITLVKHL